MRLLGEGELEHAGPEDRAAEEATRFIMSALEISRASVHIGSATALGGADYVVSVSQRMDGNPVDGAFGTVLVGPTGVRYANLRFLRALGPVPEARISGDEARLYALDEALSFAGNASIRGAAELVLAVGGSGDVVPVWRVEVDTRSPSGWWAIRLDARDASTLDLERLSSHIEGQLRMSVEPACAGQGTEWVGMPHVRWADGHFAKDDGYFTTSETISQAEVTLDSPFFLLTNEQGPLMPPYVAPLVEGGFNTVEVLDAPLDQVDPLYHSHRVRAWVRGRLDAQNSQTAWTEDRVRLTVNIADGCNAFYDGTLNFFRAQNGCINTGQIAGIVYHEYGHGVHDHSAGQFNGQVSEGVGDYVAASILNDSRMIGIPNCDAEFRNASNRGDYCSLGCTWGPGSGVHQAGQAYSGVWWDLRAALIERYGKDLGVATTDRLFLRALNFVGNMFSAYDAAIAADDDTDGDPSNGTVHSCLINQAFAGKEDDFRRFPELDGAVPGLPSVSFSHQPRGVVSLDPGQIPEIEVATRVDRGCAQEMDTDSAVELVYQIDGGAPVRAVMERTGETDDGGVYVASLPQVPVPSTLTYYFSSTVADIENVYPPQGRAPRTATWPHYRQTVRFSLSEDVLFQADFEEDDGNLEAGPTSDADWEWGAPLGIAGDPIEAFSGLNVWGTDLGSSGDGLYEQGSTSFVELPVLDASRFETLRLQFWRYLLSADRAVITVNERVVWDHRVGSFYWRDPLWTFQDIDISEEAAGESEVRIRFGMIDAYTRERDPQTMTPELGGWNIDDVRVAGLALYDETLGESPDAQFDPPPGLKGTALNCTSTPAPGAFLVFMALWFRRKRGADQ